MKGKSVIPNTALVTGAANGLGRALAEQLLKGGTKLLAIDNDGEGLDSLKKNYPDNCETLEINLSDIDNVPKIIGEVASFTEQMSELQLVVLNAGISATGKFENIPTQTHAKIIALNATGNMILASTLAREGMMAKSSAVVFVSSLSHKTGYPGAASYAASKDAIAIYAKSITREFARKRIHVMTTFPGPIRTQHAARHAPLGASEKNRMPADKLADSILKAVISGKTQHYPQLGAKFIAIFGSIFPTAITRLMRRIIFEKLDRDIY